MPRPFEHLSDDELTERLKSVKRQRATCDIDDFEALSAVMHDLIAEGLRRTGAAIRARLAAENPSRVITQDDVAVAFATPFKDARVI